MVPASKQADARFFAEHGPLVRRIAARLCAQLDLTLEREDIEAWGKLGLLEARERFDPERGVRFSTFAYYRIRGAMVDGIRRGGYVSRRAHARLRAAEATDALAEPQAGNLPESAQARARSIDDTLGKLSAAFVIAAVGQDEEENAPVPADARLEQEELAGSVARALQNLPEREARLLRAMYFEGQTLAGAAEEQGLSKSWGSRLHARALGRLRESLLD